MTSAEINLILGLIKHGWDTGVVRGEEGAAQLVALRLKLGEMLELQKKPK